MPKIASLGALSSRGFGEFAQSGPVTYIEDVFSTYLYTGNGSTQTITNGIDLSGKGGLVWIKGRSGTYSNQPHVLTDTVRGKNSQLFSNNTSPASTDNTTITNFLSSGFTLGDNTGPSGGYWSNYSGTSYASWTFEKQPKFFDVVTYTGTGSVQNISHNLGSVPGMILIKRTDGVSDWSVYHRSTGNTQVLFLNSTSAAATSSAYWNNTTPTSTVFTVGSGGANNNNGASYIAYLFAHDAGGFGLDGTQNVISCGSYVGASGGSSITLGYEPQFVLVKKATANNGGLRNWVIVDTMRGFFAPGNYAAELYPNTSGAEAVANQGIYTNATGFTTDTFDNVGGVGETYIYMAIRRGPMKVPTDATTVFSPNVSAASQNTDVTTGFTVDTQFARYGTSSAGFPILVVDRLRGVNTVRNDTSTGKPSLATTNANVEDTTLNITNGWNNTGFQIPAYSAGASSIYLNFRRAPSFMDVVCYTGTGSASTVSHNLGVTPELIIVKCRSAVANWWIYNKSCTTNLIFTQVADGLLGTWVGSPTATTFSLLNTTNNGTVNDSGSKYVAYLFASCPGVSKVGSYTGTGATQTISCGFTGGARYVLIKRIDSTGNWWVWDTARGMISGTDPRLAYNNTDAEINNNWVYTTTGGFQIVTSDATVNANGGTYIYLAIAQRVGQCQTTLK